jgi:putative oxidoreductase
LQCSDPSRLLDHEALVLVFSDPGKFYVADPYTFLYASLMVMIFGAGVFAVDTFLLKRFRKEAYSCG